MKEGRKDPNLGDFPAHPYPFVEASTPIIIIIIFLSALAWLECDPRPSASVRPSVAFGLRPEQSLLAVRPKAIYGAREKMIHPSLWPFRPASATKEELSDICDEKVR